MAEPAEERTWIDGRPDAVGLSAVIEFFTHMRASGDGQNWRVGVHWTADGGWGCIVGYHEKDLLLPATQARAWGNNMIHSLRNTPEGQLFAEKAPHYEDVFLNLIEAADDADRRNARGERPDDAVAHLPAKGTA